LGELTLDQKWRRGNGRSAAVSKFKQSFHVGLGGFSQSYHFVIHDLLARQTNARDEPRNGGMKPERGANDFFAQVMHPIVAASMKQFVTRNRGLESSVHGREIFGKQNYRC